MTERPILFSAPMVQAILAGRKTMTRRVINKSAALDALHVFGPSMLLRPGCADLCPYGKPGDRLWVREAWQTDVRNASTPPRDISELEPVWFMAGGEPVRAGSLSVCATGWRPGIHMPRWASRITLRVTEIRVERLHAITSADAIAEGCPAHANSTTIDCDTPNPRDDFRDLWNGINGAGAWDANPWVWVVRFERVEGSNGKD